jgi:hypothetical protein
MLRPVCVLAAFGLISGAARADAPKPSPPRGLAPAAPRSPAPRGLGRLSASQRTAALATIKTTFQTSYVFPELRPKIVERLDQRQRAGRYDVEDPIVFAERITEDLREVSHDGHLSLTVNPAGYAAALAPAKSDAGEDASYRRAARRNHHGLAELRRLPGNVRSLKITGFQWVADETGLAYDGAMRFLKDGDAIIIDLRGNGGGWHQAVLYLVSHFLDPDILEETFLDGAETSQARTLAHLPAGRLQGKPLYVLIDRYSASAAEAFAYDVQQFKLGELVGARTAGAANNNRLLPVAPGFVLSVSFGRPVHPVSKTNWEGVGVTPTVESTSAQAFDVAYALALSRLAQTKGAPPAVLADYAWARVAAEARVRPPVLSAERMTALAGRYGNHEIAYREGALWMTRGKHPAARLELLSPDGLFGVEGFGVLRVRLTGKTLELLWANEPAPRVFARQ